MNSINGVTIDEALDFLTRPDAHEHVIVVVAGCVKRMRLVANVFWFDSFAERNSYLNTLQNEVDPLMHSCRYYTAAKFLENFL